MKFEKIGTTSFKFGRR